MDEEREGRIQTIIGACLLVIIVVGLCVNSMALHILRRIKIKNTSNLLFFVLTVNDILTLSLSLINSIPLIMQIWDTYVASFCSCFLAPVVLNYVSLIPFNTSKLIVCVICIDRFIALWFPTQYRTLWNKTIITKILVTIFVIVPTVSVLKVLVLRSNITVREVHNITIPVCDLVYTDFAKNYHGFLRLYTLLLELVLDIFPLIFIIVICCLIVYKLKTIKLEFDPYKPDNVLKMKHLKQGSIVQTSIIFLHLCSSLPMIVWFAIYISKPQSEDLIERLRNPDIFLLISTLLEILNTAVNSIVFIMFSPRYRKQCIKILLCCRSTKIQPNNIHTSSHVNNQSVLS